MLGCPVRTLQTRLQRGKARLRDRLVGRGLAPAAGSLAMGIESAEAASALVDGPVSAALSRSTAQASVQFAASRTARLATSAVGLAQARRSDFFLEPFMACGRQLCSAWRLGLHSVSWRLHCPANHEPARPAKTITGRILDDQGQPIAGAESLDAGLV